MMSLTIKNPYMFQSIMKGAGRDWFSLDGYEALIDLYDEYGFDEEIDPIALTCEWNEYDPEDKCLQQDYGYLLEGEDITPEELATWEGFQKIGQKLEEHTMVLWLPNKHIIVGDW